MARGGRRRDRDGPERRCIATGESGRTDRLIRFVLSPDGRAVPDLAGKLPGRGAWLTADRALVEMAVKKRLFSRAFRQPVEVEAGLADLLEDLVARRLIETISLARKAGQAVTGAEKVRAHISGGGARVLLQASDGAYDGKRKISTLARAVDGEIAHIEVLTASELGLAFGREFAIHAALDAGGFAPRVCAEAAKLAGLRGARGPGGNIDDEPATGGSGHEAAASGSTNKERAEGGGSDKDDR